MDTAKLTIADIIIEFVIFMLILFSSHCYQKVAPTHSSVLYNKRSNKHNQYIIILH